jgi:DNA gyrase subunit A
MQIVPVDIVDEMKSSYIDYAMSVIVGRAIPDVRDGLKPVQRRILYAMHEMGLLSNRSHKKSARVVGEVLGKYHPHGDTAVYDALVRMAQDFSLRYPLVDGQGNFGSIDGDNAAAMRYTEVRLSKIAEEMLKDIEKDTVDFLPNFDESLKEPEVLPSRIPNLIINGSSGIAVGMATNIPPHNLREIVDATISLIQNQNTTLEDLMEIVKGPDFPTGGIIYGKEGIRKAYRTGKGKIVVRGKAVLEKDRIIITEIPYQVSKSRLIEQIAELVKEKKLEGIKTIRDESDRRGIRVVIELKGASPEVVLNRLFKFTSLQVTYGIINLVLADGKPRLLNLRGLLLEFINHRRIVIERRTKHDLRKAEERLHIVEGLRIALQHIDKVVELIKKSGDVKEAEKGLIDTFNLSIKQAQAILNMRLQRLTALETEKLEEEFNKLQKEIAEYKAILADRRKLDSIIINELKEIREAFGDERRTEITLDIEDLSTEDMISNDEVVIIFTERGYVKRVLLRDYRLQKKGGKGVIGTGTEDALTCCIPARNRDTLLLFSSGGKAYSLPAYVIPRYDRYAKGHAINNLISLSEDERIIAGLAIHGFENGYVMMATRNGKVKRVKLSKFVNAKRAGIIAFPVEKDDLAAVTYVEDGDEVIISTKHGKSLRFSVRDVRPMGRVAMGVRGIRLQSDDTVVGIDRAEEGDTLLSLTEKGFGKRTPIEEYTLHNRGGMGVKNILTGRRNGSVVASFCVKDDDELLVFTPTGYALRTPVKQIPVMGRGTKGVIITRDGIQRAIVM